METIEDIVALFGGVRPMARAIDLPASTVSSWVIRNSIPDWHHESIFQAAQNLGLSLTVADVFRCSCTNNSGNGKPS